MKDIRQLTIKTICIILISSLIGVALLTLSFFLPDSSIQTNASRSSQQLVSVGEYPLAIAGFNGTMLDNYTDAIMINSASYIPNDASNIERALKIPHAHADWTNGPIEDLYEYYNDENAIMKTVAYQRYWHGYITVLRPLLIFCDYANIKFMYFVAHIIMLFFFLFLLKRKTNLILALSFLTSYLCTYAFITPLSLQYSHVLFITLLSGILLMRNYDYICKNQNIYYFFLIIGIVTSYMDLLTYPLITLGVNLIILILINKDIKIKNVIVLALMWTIGYGGMWAMKWFLACLILKENVFLDAYNQMVLRTGDNQNITLLDVLSDNFVYLKHSTTLLVFATMAVIVTVYKVRTIKKSRIIFNKQRLVSLIFVTVLPILWYAILKEHSSSHSVFTFRSLIISLFAILAMSECLHKHEDA